MSIRYECDGCGSVVKIKESLAGTSGKCPTCKKKFVVPQKGADSGVALENTVDSAIKKSTPVPAAKAAAPVEKPAAAAPSPGSAAADGEFDLDAFLMDDSVPNAKASAGLSAPPPSPAAPPPKFDKQGRRTIAAPPPSPGSSAEIPTQESSASLSANSRDLLSKTPKATAVPGAPRKPLINFDLKGTLLQLRQSALYVVGAILLAIGAFWISNRLMSSRLELPKLGAVSGTVTLNGQPLKNVVVHLTPLSPLEGKSVSGKQLRLRDATGATDESGYFELQYIEGVGGAPLGKARIWIEPLNPTDYKKIPGSYLTSGSTDIREVKAVGNESKFNIELKSSK